MCEVMCEAVRINIMSCNYDIFNIVRDILLNNHPDELLDCQYLSHKKVVTFLFAIKKKTIKNIVSLMNQLSKEFTQNKELSKMTRTPLKATIPYLSKRDTILEESLSE